jgi:RNA polymerase sigma factor (TIGR02999 family)
VSTAADCGPLRPSPSSQLTDLLRAWSAGEPDAADRLLAVVYAELRREARRFLRRERADHTLRPTALVHEAYLRLAAQHEAGWENRAQFFAVAAQAMRRVLVDHARRRKAQKRPAARLQVELAEDAAVAPPRPADLLALDAALEDLAARDPRRARLVELRFFAGLTVPEAAQVLGVSPRTVDREWQLARAWLHRRLASP